jgi:hypothetical protein
MNYEWRRVSELHNCDCIFSIPLDLKIQDIEDLPSDNLCRIFFYSPYGYNGIRRIYRRDDYVLRQCVHRHRYEYANAS